MCATPIVIIRVTCYMHVNTLAYAFGASMHYVTVVYGCVRFVRIISTLRQVNGDYSTKRLLWVLDHDL